MAATALGARLRPASARALPIAEAEQTPTCLDSKRTVRRRVKLSVLCFTYVLLSASGPILLDWVKRGQGGRFTFSVPALTFHAWGLAALLGLSWTAARGQLRQLYRPDMLWRFCVTTSMFTAGDMLSFSSLQHLDVGTFSLVGKTCAIILTVLLTRVILRRRQTPLQYGLVVVVAACTCAFCIAEQAAHATVGVQARTSQAFASALWTRGLVQRVLAVFFTSLGAVFQEKLLLKEPRTPFMMQQCWMGFGAVAMSYFTLRVLYGLPSRYLLVGFGDWRVLFLLVMYVATGLMTGLVVKKLGAVAKALCVPVYLGGCYMYAVQTGTAALTPQVIVSWMASTSCVLMFAVSKAAGDSRPPKPRPGGGESAV